MGWNDRDYNRNRRPEPDDDTFVPPARDDSSWEEDQEIDGEVDDDAADPDDPEAPDATDRDDGDEPACIRCPNCRRMIVEDAERCPHCGEYVEDEKVNRGGRPVWVWVGIILAILVAVIW